MTPSMPRACGRALGALLAACAAGSMPATAEAAFGDRPLRPGARGHDVRVLQGWLTRLGFDVAVDGRFGRLTAGAVRRFEQRHRPAVDGRVGRADAAAMRALVEGRGSVRGAPRADADADDVTAPAGSATLAADGRTAIAPPDAPAAVVRAIAAANALTRKPYVYGGGHGRWDDRGYDCSGAVSYVLHAASLLDTALDSSGLARWGERGPGDWITVYGNRGHAYMTIAGLRFDTSGRGERGPRWRTEERSAAGYAMRHPDGL